MKHCFLLGNPRSGTSLLRLMLDNHPLVTSPPECGFAHWWLNKYEFWIPQGKKYSEIDSFLEDILSSKKIDTWNLDRARLRQELMAIPRKQYSDLVDSVYLAYARKSMKAPTIIVDKNNYYIYHLKDLPRIWPDALYLHIVRDGRDVACSYLEVNTLQTDSPYKPDLPTSLEMIAREWHQNNQNILSFLAMQGSDRSLTIRYEDLIINTADILSRICSFLKIDYSESMLNYHRVQSRHSKEPKETLDWKKKTLEKPDATRISRYKTELERDQIEMFDRIAFQTLKRFNYV